MLVPLAVLGFVVGSYADCSKDEIFKLLDKGYSKAEVDGICGKSKKKSSSKWITPTNSVCKSNGGNINKDNVCEANWRNAKNICSVNGGRLATYNELKKVILDCGGIINDNKNIRYKSCFEKKGFVANNDYWSSTTDALYNSSAWGLFFYGGGDLRDSKTTNSSVICIK